MSTQSDNFINELKYDAIKNNIKDFLSGNIKKILILLLLILAIYLTRYIIVNHRKNKILNYNSKIFESLVSKESITELEKLYNDENIPRISKTLTGLNLINEYTKNLDNKNVTKIYEDILDNEDDIYLKYYSGLNLLILKLNDETIEDKYIQELFNRLENEENPLIDMVKEQKILFLIKNCNYDDTKKIINNILSNEDVNISFKDRIKIYSDYINN